MTNLAVRTFFTAGWILISYVLCGLIGTYLLGISSRWLWLLAANFLFVCGSAGLARLAANDDTQTSRTETLAIGIGTIASVGTQAAQYGLQLLGGGSLQVASLSVLGAILSAVSPKISAIAYLWALSGWTLMSALIAIIGAIYSRMKPAAEWPQWTGIVLMSGSTLFLLPWLDQKSSSSPLYYTVNDRLSFAIRVALVAFLMGNVIYSSDWVLRGLAKTVGRAQKSLKLYFQIIWPVIALIAFGLLIALVLTLLSEFGQVFRLLAELVNYALGLVSIGAALAIFIWLGFTLARRIARGGTIRPVHWFLQAMQGLRAWMFRPRQTPTGGGETSAKPRRQIVFAALLLAAEGSIALIYLASLLPPLRKLATFLQTVAIWLGIAMIVLVVAYGTFVMLKAVVPSTGSPLNLRVFRAVAGGIARHRIKISTVLIIGFAATLLALKLIQPVPQRTVDQAPVAPALNRPPPEKPQAHIVFRDTSFSCISPQWPYGKANRALTLVSSCFASMPAVVFVAIGSATPRGESTTGSRLSLQRGRELAAVILRATGGQGARVYVLNLGIERRGVSGDAPVGPPLRALAGMIEPADAVVDDGMVARDLSRFLRERSKIGDYALCDLTPYPDRDSPLRKPEHLDCAA